MNYLLWMYGTRLYRDWSYSFPSPILQAELMQGDAELSPTKAKLMQGDAEPLPSGTKLMPDGAERLPSSADLMPPVTEAFPAATDKVPLMDFSSRVSKQNTI